MILEALIGVTALKTVYDTLNEDSKARKEEIKNIKNKWEVLLDGLGSASIGNKINQRYSLDKIFIKHYGFDSIVSLPYGTEPSKVREFIPKIQVVYGAEVIAEPTNDNKTVYMRVHYHQNDISEKDSIKFKWYKIFHKGDRFRNTFAQTFTIIKMMDILNPYNKKEIVGYLITVRIPYGLSYDSLKNSEGEITKSIGKCIVRWNSNNNEAEVEVILRPISDNMKFKPVKPKTPYEFMLAMSYSYKVISADLSKMPHLLYTGKTQTGKTVCVLTGITNLAYYYNEDDFILFESMISAKQDLRIFADLRQCMYYAGNLDKSLRLFKYIKNEMFQRNRTFATSKRFCGSMYSWNEMHPDKKMPLILLAIDEMTLYSPRKSDNERVAGMKQECVDILRQLLIEGASAGINVLFSLQRPDKESLDTTIKGQLGNIIGFYQPNSASSLVAMDDYSCTKLAKKREAIVKYSDGEELVKTLWLSHDDIRELLKDKIVGTDHHLVLTKNGEIKVEDPEEEKQVKVSDNKGNVKKIRYFTNISSKKEGGSVDKTN